MEEVKGLVKNFALIDIDDIPNDDLEAALEAIGHDQELMTALEEGPSF